MSITELEELIDALLEGQTPARARRLLMGQGASAERLARVRRVSNRAKSANDSDG